MTDSPRPALAPAPAAAVNLETELTCSICTDLLYQPLTLLDCLHTFCGACLKEWFRFQALRAEPSPGGPPPPPPGTPIFTCPSCRDPVRDTKHDARVATLLDMFLGLYPERGRSEEEKREAERGYKRGERVLPKIRVRTEEERRADEEERRLVEEVRRVSLREATEGSGNRSDGGREGGRSAGGGSGGRRRTQSAALRVERGGGGGGEGRRRRSESRQRADEAGAARQVEHQSSLRNLISADGMDTRDIEREIEEFARQIQEEGLLEGLDLDNLDLENNDELSRKITDAYRRRHLARTRADGGRRSNASAHSHRSDLSGRPRSRTGEVSRPASRHTIHSRAPSTSSNDERGRYPPSSSSAHLDVQEPARRRRTPSGGRSATVPVGPTQSDIRVASRSQTDLVTRSGTAADPQASRPSMGGDARSTSSPTTVTASGSRGDSPSLRGLPFSTRAAGAFGILIPAQLESPSDSPTSSARPAGLVSQESPTFGPTSGPLISPFASPPLASPRRVQTARYKEPLINCNTCSKESIQYDLHFNCSLCHHGEWNICLDCWRRRKGCLHWFGFGAAAWSRWEKHNLTGQPTQPPHTLTAHRYLPPRTTPTTPPGNRTITTTTENPLDRLQSGTFCSSCAAWTTKTCHWRCDVCNEGEWGFCSACVSQGLVCTHPLLALSYSPPPTTTETNTGPGTSTGPGSTSNPHPHIPALTPPCSHCHTPIPHTSPHYHCYTCSSPEEQEKEESGYNLCRTCYTSLVSSGTISPENGPSGWRRCPRGGHRMVMVSFIPDAHDHQLRRNVVRDLVGGRRLRVEGSDVMGRECWVWVDSGGRKVERTVAREVGETGSGGGLLDMDPGFPADGGAGMRAVAGWGWIPAAEGGEDELMFPKGAEVVEVDDVNGEWFHGFYMGKQGLFPAPYVRLVGR